MSDMSAPTTFPRLLAARAEREPGLVVHSTSGGRHLSLGNWQEWSGSIAAALVERGVQPADRIGLLFTSAEWIELAVGYIGVHRCGATAVLLPSTWSTTELLEVLDRSGCVGVVGASSLPTGVAGGHTTALAAGLNGDRRARWTLDVTDLIGGRPTPCGPLDMDVSKPDALADILFTSGTGATPKGVAYSQANATFEARHRGGAIPWVVDGGLCVHAHPPFGAAGQARVVAPLLAGISMFACERFEPRQFLETIEGLQAPHVSLVPAMAMTLATWPGARSFDLHCVQMVSFGSAAMAESTLPELARIFPNAALVNQYSSTEALPARVRGTWDRDHPVTAGLPDHETEIRIVDPVTCTPLARGSVGEVWLRVPGLDQRFYADDEHATREVFAEGGWTRMGDVGRIGNGGTLELLDRLKDIINRGGVTISPREIEAALESHPSVREAAVFGTPHDVLGEEIAAAVTVTTSVEEAALRDHVRSLLAAMKVPRRIVIVEELPRNDALKVRRAALASLLAERLSHQSPDPDGTDMAHPDPPNPDHVSPSVVQEIETALARHREIESCAVVADSRGALVAYMVVVPGTLPGSAVLRRHLAEARPSLPLPARFVALDRLPVDERGAVDRELLGRGSTQTPSSAAALQAQTPRRTESRHEPTDTEKRIAERIVELLELDRIGPEDDFFDVGGDSLAAIELCSWISAGFLVPFDATDLPQMATVPEIAMTVDRIMMAGSRTGGGSVAILAGNADSVGDSATVILIAGGGDSLLSMRPLARLIAELGVIVGAQAIDSTASQSTDPSVRRLAKRLHREVITLAPAGSFVVCGYSFGGAVAHELACRLERSGRYVRRVIILDTPRQPVPDRVLALRMQLQLRSRVRNVGNRVLSRMRPSRSSADSKSASEQVATTAPLEERDRLRYSKGLAFDEHTQAQRAHRPRSLRAPILVVRAKDGQRDRAEYERWADYTTALSIVDVPGTHATLKQDPYVGGVARAILSTRL
jgi:acyl-CoA synthetase (AMP-forming)/AMP-acid ligase II/thioesterase domain-containing protein/acyl carrier protein